MRAFLRTFGLLVLLLDLTVAVRTEARAQNSNYPNQLVKMVVGFPPGGFPDMLARLYAENLGRQLNQTFVVENRPSAQSIVAASQVVASPADGYTLFVAEASLWAMARQLHKNLRIDPLRDFAPVSLLGTTAFFFA